MNDISGEWWTAPTESESGRLIMVTGRDDVGRFRDNPRFSIRVEVGWDYGCDASGMPGADDAAMMEAVTDRLADAFRKDPVAVMTGIYTGDGLATGYSIRQVCISSGASSTRLLPTCRCFR